jgi:hypothetical protein
LENQFQERGYGPCQNSLCGCSCSSRDCVCANAGLSSYENEDGLKLANLSSSGRARDGNLSGRASSSLFSHSNGNGEMKLVSSSVEGNFGVSGVNARLGLDLANIKTDGVQLRVGLNADTGFSTDKGLEVKVGGFGFNVGDQTGISTPFGELKVDTEDCVIQ